MIALAQVYIAFAIFFAVIAWFTEDKYKAMRWAPIWPVLLFGTSTTTTPDKPTAPNQPPVDEALPRRQVSPVSIQYGRRTR